MHASSTTTTTTTKLTTKWTFFLLSLLCITYPQPSTASLTVTYTNTSSTLTTGETSTLELHAVYATVGDTPDTPVTFNSIQVIHVDECDWQKYSLEGKLVVFTKDILFAMFEDCNTAHQGNGVVVARVAQKHGAVGVVVRAADKLEGGRGLGFTSDIDIPVMVISQSNMKFFSRDDIGNLSVQFPVASSHEKGQINHLKRIWLAWKVTTSFIYAFLTLLVTYLFYLDILKFRRRGYVNNNFIMKGISLYSMIVSLLWTAVDPFGFEGIFWWKNSMLINLQFSGVVIVFTMILLMWIQAVRKMNFTSKKRIAAGFYVFCFVIWLISFIFGFFWYVDTTNQIYSRGITIIFVVLAISYCVVGKDMVVALHAARNTSYSHMKLITKIGLFISWYVSIAIGVAIVYSIGILGPIFQLMFTIFFEGMALSGAYVILFFQPFRHGKNSSDT